LPDASGKLSAFSEHVRAAISVSSGLRICELALQTPVPAGSNTSIGSLKVSPTLIGII
jgi:hypothetical protein